MKLSLLSVAALLSTAVAASNPPDVLDDETFANLTLPEFTPSGDRIVDLRLSSSTSALDKRAVCNGNAGIANGQCVRYYSAGGCQDRDHIKGYKPTCQGNCYVDRFLSVHVAGDGTYSTNCELFADAQCQSSLGGIGSKTGFGKCKTSQGYSMKCYYRC